MGKANKTKNNANKESKVNNKNKKNSQKKSKKIWSKILIALVVFIIILAGIGAGIIFGLMGGKYAITKDDLIIELSNSIVVNEEEETLAVLNGTENRKILSKSEMGKYLPDAFVAIEDKRFYSHKGIDIKRTAAAVMSFVFNRGEASTVGGGSTITQQLVKNITNEKEDSGTAGAIRKIKEMIRAYQVENIISKDQILESYMNIIFLGGNVNGVGMASQYYFSKEAKDLSLAESAFLAGITHGPNGYNPFDEDIDRTEKIKNRTIIVLKFMKEQGKINEEEYNEAIKEVEKGLKFEKGKIIDLASYSSHTEALIKQIVNQLVTEKGMDYKYAETYLLSNGFTIYSTEVDDIQKALEKEYAKKTYQVKTTVTKTENGKTKKVKETAQSAMVIIDHKTGKVVGAVGVLGEKGAGELNRATQTVRQPGSAIKPIGVYGPALEEKVITAASVYDDIPLKYGTWTPGNAYAGYKGLSNMRLAIRISQNTVAIQTLDDLTIEKGIQYLKRLGITSLVDEKDNNLSLALGGINKGISPLEMAGAYAAIANDGEYITPTFYTKVVDKDGNVIIEANQEKERVFSKENSYILKQLLTEPTKSGGTATICKISKMDTALKTGTTNSVKDLWSCGFTPYYTAAVWYGYDTPTAIPGHSYANTIWKNVMSTIHKKLDAAKFKKPDNIISVAVCKDSGLRATEECKNDQRGSRVYTEYFVKGTVPSKTCTCHEKGELCKISGKVAGEFCKEKEEKVFITREKSGTYWKKTADAKYMLPEETCDKCKADTVLPVITLNGTASINLKVGEVYTELSATAKDDVDGDITSKIITTGTVDTTKVGTYTITYTVSDIAGNTATTTRTIIVSAAVTVPSAPTKPEVNTNTNANTTNTVGITNTVQ